MIELTRAEQLCRAKLARVEHEQVSLDAALGRILAQPLLSRWPLPVHDHAAMDGYGVCAADLADVPRELEVVGVAAPGDPYTVALAAGQAVRILTGARIPPGVDAVIKQEDIERVATRVRVSEAVEPGRNIRRRGEDVEAGHELVAAGTQIDADVIMALASFGHATVVVTRTVHVALLTCGDELVRVAEADPERVVDIAGPTLAAACRELGCTTRVFGPARDRLDELQRTITDAIASAPDVLITIGGASVGDRDHIAAALESHGFAWEFRGVDIKPGKPTGFGLLAAHAGASAAKPTPVFVLPGNPGAARVMFGLLAAPALMHMQGRDRGPLRRTAITTVDLPRARDRASVLQVRARESGGRLWVDRGLGNSAARVSPRLDANASLLLEPAAGPLPAGSSVELELRRAPERWPGPPVLAFIGTSGSGKTTIIARLLERLAELRVGVIKHGRHFELDKPGKDSDRFRAAGARAVVIHSAKLTATLEHDAGPVGVHELLGRLPVGLDLVLVEGFKTAGLPSIEVHCDDRELLCGQVGFEHVIAVASNRPERVRAGVRVCERDDLAGLERLVREWVTSHSST